MLLISQFFALILVCIPVILWGYLFSTIDIEMRSARKFIYGIATGALLMLPIVYSRDIYGEL